jgi:GntR family transcriptional regulator/MocR family aminotransferase
MGKVPFMRLRDFTLHLSSDEHIPLFRRVAQAIVHAIRQGRILPGQALPGTRALADQLGVSRPTVIQAIQELEAEGWLLTEPSRGTFVPDQLPEPQTSKGISRPKPLSARPEEPGFDLPSRLKPLTRADAAAIDLSEGVPDSTLAPTGALAKAYQRALRRHGDELLGSGEPVGQSLLREQLAAWFSERQGLAIHKEQILVTRGSRAALTLIALSLLREGDAVAVENPGNRSAWETLQHSVLVDLVPIPVDGQGMVVDALEAVLKTREIRAILTTPRRQFPTTVALEASRRRKLLDLAAAHRIPIIEDDHDAEYGFSDQPLPPLAAQDPGGQVIFTAGLGRLLAPGVRLGCIVGPPLLVDRLARVQRNLEAQGDHVMEWAAAELIRDGDLARHLRKARKVYEGRMRFLLDQIRSRLGGALGADSPPGGLALWVRFLDGEDPGAWIDAMRVRGLVLRRPEYFFLGEAQPFTRMGFAQATEEVLEEAVSRMIRAQEDLNRNKVR